MLRRYYPNLSLVQMAFNASQIEVGTYTEDQKTETGRGGVILETKNRFKPFFSSWLKPVNRKPVYTGW